jgi:phosphoenolpyruvate carboxylase
MRKIPSTMATQHPDHARKPYWHSEAFIDTKHEAEECYRSYRDLECEEYMWDWEGKYVDEAVIERLIENYFEFFKENQLGRDVFLTFRLPNIWEEKGYRIARAFVNIITAQQIAREFDLHTPPIFEVILPMTTSASKIFFIKKRYAELAKAFSGLRERGPSSIQVIPLVERADDLAQVDRILQKYVELCRKDKLVRREGIQYLRPFLARSDPALNSSSTAATLAVKTALSKCSEFSEKTGIETFPITGMGSLPFRGNLNPETVDSFLEDYAGVRTATVQSAFRYDYGLPKVRSAIERLNTSLEKGKTRVYDKSEVESLRKLIRIFSKHYRPTIESISGLVNKASAFVPPRRERRLHTGLFGYSRKVGNTHLPRVITFVCSLYSLGIPPEVIGAGRALREAKRRSLLGFLEENYSGLRSDLIEAGHYLNRENLRVLSSSYQGLRAVEEDIDLVQEILGIELGPVETDHFIHRNITSNIRLLFAKGKDVTDEIVRAGEIRKSLG